MTAVHSSGLDEPTLVLNKGWQAIDAITARQAISDTVAEKARIICPKSFMLYSIEDWMDLPVAPGDLSIQTVHKHIRVPEVVVFNEYDRIPKRSVVFSRRNLWRRDGWRCQYCGKKPAPDEITVDHVVPRAQGGLTTFENTVLACLKCNKHKDNRTPEQAGMKLRKMVRAADGSVQIVFYSRPKAPRWSPIFAVRRQKVPESWSKFLPDRDALIHDLYWDSELEP